MKKTIIFLFFLGVIAGCGKHNAVGPPGLVSSITYYDVSQHRVDIESFEYNGAQLTSFTSRIFDSTAPFGYEMLYAMETVVYRFQFSDSLTSTTDTSGCCGSILQWTWDYSGAGFGVNLRFNSPSLVRYDSVLFNNAGNAYSYVSPAMVGTVFGSVRNPLYNPAFAGNLGPLLFEVGRPGALSWLPFKVDFLSKNLLVSAGSPAGDDYRITITWLTGSNGRVSGGTVTDMFVPTNAYDSFFGPVKISYSYQ